LERSSTKSHSLLIEILAEVAVTTQLCGGERGGGVHYVLKESSQIPHFDIHYNYSDKFDIVSKLFKPVVTMKISSNVRKLTYFGVLSATLFMDVVLTKALVPLYLG
jgi:hypothetical protein